MEVFNASSDFILRLVVATVLGVLLGTERIIAHKTAGMRTYALVAMGSALFVAISESVSNLYTHSAGLSPTFIAGQIVSGIGFLGAGLIIFKDSKLTGLTTATGIWVSAGIGMAAGFGLFSLAITATLLTLFIFVVLWYVEQRIIKMSEKSPNDKKEIED
jgi:putative Mg2+ transporter-C (MgtC) family protein